MLAVSLTSRLLGAPRTALLHPQMQLPEQLPDHLTQMMAEITAGEAQLFDVREPQEQAQGMLACAEKVPLSMLQNGYFSQGYLDSSKITYLHCAAGIRVHPSAAILADMGFERIVPLQEGFGALYNLGLPLADDDE